MEIEPEEYIRTNIGVIDKIIKYDEILEEYWLEKGQVIDINNGVGIYLKDIVKHSKDIKELVKARRYNRMAKRRWLLLWNK